MHIHCPRQLTLRFERLHGFRVLTAAEWLESPQGCAGDRLVLCSDWDDLEMLEACSDGLHFAHLQGGNGRGYDLEPWGPITLETRNDGDLYALLDDLVTWEREDQDKELGEYVLRVGRGDAWRTVAH